MEKRKMGFEVRKEGNRVEGYVLKYNCPTDTGSGNKEMFKPGSIRVDDKAEMLFNHNSNNLLGRKGANLEFEDRADGLYYRLELPKTTLGKDVKALINEKIISGASLGFNAGKERYEGDVRIIEDSMLRELSLVSSPAYESSSAYIRSLKKRVRQLHWGRLILGG